MITVEEHTKTWPPVQIYPAPELINPRNRPNQAILVPDWLITSHVTSITRERLLSVLDQSKQPIRTRYLGHVTGYQPIRDQYFLIRSDCFLYWTKVIKRICSSIDDTIYQAQPASHDTLFLSPLPEAYLAFVRAWRSFLVVTLVVRENKESKLKDQITFHIAGALYNQTAKLDRRVALKASAEFASLLVILLRHHRSSSDQPVLVKVCVQVLDTAAKSPHDLTQIVIIPVLASLLNVFQGLPADTKAQVMQNSESITELVTLLCTQITSNNPKQLIALSCATLSQVIDTLGSECAWFGTIKHVIPGLVQLTEEGLLANTHEVCEALLSLILCLSNYKESANTLHWCNIQKMLCFAQLYGDKLENGQLQRLWFLVIQIVISLLQTLKMKFSEDAVLFASIRHDRLMTVIGSLRNDFTYISEAEHSSTLLYSLASYLDTWHMRAPHCLSDVGTILGTIIPIVSHYLTSSVSGEKEDTTSQVLSMLANLTAMLRIMTPTILSLMREKIGIQCLPAPLLALSFTTPPLGTEGPPSYGILTGCLRGCLTLLQRVDPIRATTPTRTESETSVLAQKSQIIFIMENTLYVLMSQSQQAVMDINMDPNDVYHLRRELGIELKTILEGVHRHFRKGSSVASPRLDRKLSCSSSYGNILEQSHLSFFKLGYQRYNPGERLTPLQPILASRRDRAQSRATLSVSGQCSDHSSRARSGSGQCSDRRDVDLTQVSMGRLNATNRLSMSNKTT
eukprot:sb/3462427/